jgi:hypothetical protein
MISKNLEQVLESGSKKLELGAKENPTSTSLQLGLYVGEYIVLRYLPTLSCEGLKTNTQISVTCAEGDEFRRLLSLCYETSMFKDEELRKSKFDDAFNYLKILEDKYLPKTLSCSIPYLNISDENLNDFKEGLILTLWDCDCCHYSLEPQDIIVSDGEVILKKR